CGVCGKGSLEAILTPRTMEPDSEGASIDTLHVSPSVIHSLPSTLRAAQAVFDRTGGNHAAALFDIDGRLILFREDIGRHNALDKLVGAQLFSGAIPLRNRILLLSGRAS